MAGSQYLIYPGSSWYMAPLFFVHAWMTFILLIFTALRSRICAYVLLPLLLLPQFLFYYILSRYGIFLEAELVTAALETTWKQLSGFIYPKHYVTAPILVTFAIICIHQARKRLILPPFLSTRLVCILFFGYSIFSALLLHAGVVFFPRQTSYLTYAYRTASQDSEDYRKQVMYDMIQKNEFPYIYKLYLPFYPIITIITNTYQYFHTEELEKAETRPSACVFDEQDTTVVLLIGESYRADHSPWNGYERELLPETSQHLDNIINIPYMKSYATTTITSIYGMLSDATCQNRKATKTSFLSVLAKHGYQNHLCVSNTGYWYNQPHIRGIIDGKIHTLHQNTTYDEIEASIAGIVQTQGKKMIIIEDGIGHVPYRHDPDYTKYSESEPDQPDKADGLRNTNAYDNCLLQADNLFARIIQQLKGKDAILFYSADHGQSFGEQGFYIHGGLLNVEKQRHVFSFVWFSDKYAEKHPHIVAGLKANRNKPLSHDNIYHSIISMAGIKSEVQETNLDVTKALELPDVDHFSLDDE